MPTTSAAPQPTKSNEDKGRRSVQNALYRVARATSNHLPQFHRKRTGESTLLWLIVRKRVLISIAAFATLVLLDLYLFPVRPLDLLAWNNPWLVSALAMLAAGLAIRSWAAGTLHKNKELTRTGPYAFVRNPLYLGSFLMMVAFCLLINDGWSLAFIAGPVALMYWFSVKSEERLLTREFPEAWAAYSQSTPRFIPWKPQWPSLAGWSLAQWRKNDEYNAIVASLIGLAGLWFWRTYSL
jgi:protein-S-isoprenylcysteine O-methyltransferase Ste14